MADDLPTRVRFADRQFLHAADLRDEQRYHRAARWRHNRAVHSWGVVAGLEVNVEEADGRFRATVGPGMALDGYGRELVVPYRLTADARLDPDTAYDVWLEYAEGEPSPGRPAGSCPRPDDRPARTEERPRVRVTPRTRRQNPDPSRPDAVPPGDLDIGPDRSPPDGAPWPVFLAGVAPRPGGESAAARWAVDEAERRWAGLVAERIESRPPEDGPAAPDRPRTVILNGGEPGRPGYRFAVATADADLGSGGGEVVRPFLAVREVQRPPDPKNENDNGGVESRVELRADRVAVAGDLTLRDGSALEFAPNPVGRESDHDGPIGTGLWRVYRHFEPPKGFRIGPNGESTFETEYADELRVTMPAAPAGANRVSIGCVGSDGAFTPVLTVLGDQSVEVRGNLTVEGGFRGTPSEVPAGQTGDPGPASGENLRSAIVRFLVRTADPGRFRFVLGPVAAHPEGPAKLTDFLVASPSAVDVGPLAESWWGGNPGKAVEAVGAASSKAAADTFKKFLGELGTLAGPTPPAAVTVFGTWATTTAGNGAKLARGFPESKTALTEFATELVAPANVKRLEALIDALLDAAGGPKAVVTRLVVPKTHDEEMVRQLFTTDGHRKDNYGRAGGHLTATKDHVQAFLQNLGAEAREMLAAELLGDNAGKRAVALGLFDENLPASNVIADLTNTGGTRLRAFLAQLRDRSADAADPAKGQLLRVKMAMKSIASMIDQAGF